MFGTVLDMGVAFVAGWVVHRYGWTNLVTWVKNWFADLIQAEAKKLQTPVA